MTRLYISIAVSAQLLAGAALAQSAGGTAFGDDWSTSLGSAMFAGDRTTVRSADEIGTQWITLSEEDQSTIRRDCMVHMQAPVDGAAGTDAGTLNDGGATTGADATTDMGTSPEAGTGTDSTTADTGTTLDGAASTGTETLSVTAAQMDEICAATNDL